MEHIAGIIHRILSGKQLEHGVKQAEVIAQWPDIAGTTVAGQAEAVALEGGILFLRVIDSAWRNELSMMTDKLVEKINIHFGENRVHRIHVI